jgi:hypothetical protein
MSTYSAHRRVTSSSHRLNGGPRGYYRGNLPWVQWVTGYSPKVLDTIGSLQWKTAREQNISNQEMTQPL